MPVIVDAKVEIEWVPGSGTFTDISTRCGRVQIDRPAPDRTTKETAPTLLTIDLNNSPDATGFCPFTPDSPVAANYPNIEPDRRIRVTALQGASSWVRFFGWTDRWVPSIDDGEPSKSRVTLTGSDVLSRYARRPMLSYWAETALETAGRDYWPFDDGTDATILRGLSSDAGTPCQPGQVVYASGRPSGTAALSSPDGGHLTDGQIEFTRGDDNAPAPVVLLTLRPGQLLSRINASLRLTTDPAGLTDDAITAYDLAGNRLWRFCASLSSGTISWVLYDDSDTPRTFYDTHAPRDDSWRYMELRFLSATSTSLTVYDKGGRVLNLGSFTWPYDPRAAAFLVVGGQMPPKRWGKQTNTLQGGVSSFLVQYANPFTYAEFAVPGITTDADRVGSFLSAHGDPIDNLLVGSIGGGGSDDRQLMYTNATHNLLDRWNEHVLSTCGHLSVRPDGKRRYLTASAARPTAVTVTLDAADDLDMPSGGFEQVKDERPTRVTASGPIGSETVIDDTTEALTGLQLEGASLATSAGSRGSLRAVAALQMATRGARLSSFGVDLTLTGTNKVAAVMGLLQGQRIRVTGLPSAYAGRTYQDVYASGWSETYEGAARSAAFTFDTDPADDPTELVMDDAEYGRVAIGDGAATITGGTCVGTTGTGTIVVTSSSPLTTGAGNYPMDLDWQGERITVSAPGGSTSPQTLTVTARGVAPTVARAHPSGQPVEIWHAARMAP